MNLTHLILTVILLISAGIVSAKIVHENEDPENTQLNDEGFGDKLKSEDVEEHTRDKRVSRDSRQLIQAPQYYPFQHIGYPPEFYQNQFYNPFFQVNGLKMDEVGTTDGATGPGESTIAPNGGSTMIDGQQPVDLIQTTTIDAMSTAEEVTTVTEPIPVVTVPSAPNPAPPAPPARGLAQYCQQARGQFQSPFSCKRFINCWDGMAVEQECAGGLLFSDENGCDYPYNVKCNERPLNDEPNPRICDHPHRRYSNPNNCSEYFVCDNRRLVKFSCPIELHYNFEVGVCDYPYRARCEQARYFRGRNIIDQGALKAYNQQSEIEKVKLKCQPSEVLRLSKDCSRVAFCNSDGTYQFINCPQNSQFDKITGECILDGTAKC